MSLSEVVRWIYYTPLIEVVFYILLFWAGLQLFSMLVVKALGRMVGKLQEWAEKNK
jgi:hypothetical protein